ncbi:MAG: YicC family protein [Blastocatellia bacterium]|nr:YicC family protein [Chloracidobacterium sp.]MBL8183326.1 YicC family protein [Blastocatellia bacterium]HRJ89301.1 YicC family protein [Pyrinomonadaceae bacterium]HRK51659.1 YicC family protein [Pyrinomonadaceae bacterium]
MRSMTGFGRGSFTDESLAIAVELKTVNNRFLDVNMRLPSEMQALESNFKRLISGRLSRGRVEVNVQYDREEAVVYELNRPLIEGYLRAIKEMQDEFALSGEPDLNVVARLPNVLLTKKAELEDAFSTAAENALNLALDDLEQMRESEGAMLQAEVSQRLDEIEKRLLPIEAEAGTIGEEYRLRLTKRIGEMLAKSESQIEIDQGRLAQEIAYIADRSDISEEIARLRTHIEHFRTIMNEEKEVGKRLDFLTQELNREANTITSKTNNMSVKENALQIKSEIEKIREQVQNVE